MATEVEKAYAAAMVDGEGYISITKCKRKENRAGVAFIPVVGIINSNKLMLEKIQEAFPNSLVIQRTDSKVGKWRKGIRPTKEVYRLIFKQKNATQFLEEIYPYLQIKKKQAENLFKLQAIRHSNGKCNYDDSVIEEQFNLYIDNRKLNRTILKDEEMSFLRADGTKYSLRISESEIDNIRPDIRKSVQTIRALETPRLCTVDGCKRKHEGLGYCKLHRRRIKEGKHLDTALSNQCLQCNKDISHLRSDRRFCSLSCKGKYHRAKRKAPLAPKPN